MLPRICIAPTTYPGLHFPHIVLKGFLILQVQKLPSLFFGCFSSFDSFGGCLGSSSFINFISCSKSNSLMVFVHLPLLQPFQSFSETMRLSSGSGIRL